VTFTPESFEQSLATQAADPDEIASRRAELEHLINVVIPGLAQREERLMDAIEDGTLDRELPKKRAGPSATSCRISGERGAADLIASRTPASKDRSSGWRATPGRGSPAVPTKTTHLTSTVEPPHHPGMDRRRFLLTSLAEGAKSPAPVGFILFMAWKAPPGSRNGRARPSGER
jgi:hypothetical protein